MSPFDALSPDQRAVVQLVLQQGRSYAQLSTLLGISEEAVRARALRGLEALAPGSTPTVPEADRALIADFLLGQQPVSARERTRTLLVGNLAANDWALDVAEELDTLAPEKVPDIPDPDELAMAAGDDEDDGDAVATEPDPVPVPTPAPPFDEDDEDDFFGDEPAVDEPRRAETAPPLAEQDYVSHKPDAPARPRAAKPAAQPARSSRIGGALLIGGAAALIAALVIFLISRGDDDEPTTDEPATQQSTPTATPEDQRQLLGQVNLRGSGGALGIAHVFLRADGKAEFELRTEKLAPNKNDAYAVWLLSRNKAERLGFSQAVGEDGNLQTRAELPANVADYEELVISRETSDQPTRPSKIVLRGSIRRALGSSGGG